MTEIELAISAALTSFSSRELFDELVRRGKIDYLEMTTIIDGRAFTAMPEEARAPATAQAIENLTRQFANWASKNGVLVATAHTYDAATRTPAHLRDMAPGSVLLRCGMFARVPDTALDDR